LFAACTIPVVVDIPNNPCVLVDIRIRVIGSTTTVLINIQIITDFGTCWIDPITAVITV
jgi:hypothetical protein